MPVGALITVGFVASTAYQIDQSKAAARDQKRSQAEADKARRLKEAKERRQMARKAILARSEAQMAGVASGAGGGSSNIQGAMGGISSQLAGGIAFNNQMSTIADNISGFNAGAMKHSQLAGYGGQAANLFMQAGMASASASSTPKASGTPAGRHAPVGGTGAPSPTYGM